MKTWLKLISFLTIYPIAVPSLFSQPFIDSIYNSNIKTVQIYKEGWELSYPIMTLNSNEKLKVSFDDLSNNPKSYYYTIVHCNSNWEPTPISYTEISDGYENNQITDKQYSINTTISYIHYSFTFPNEYCNPKISGNYILKVFENSDDPKPVFTKKFYIVECIANIELSVIRPEIAKYMARNQQFKISISPNINDYSDLRSEVKTVIMQNYNENSKKECYLIRLEGSQIMIYDDPDSNLFPGGNEFRSFDIKSKTYQSERIKSIKYDSSTYTINLYNDEWRNKKQYFSEVDLNGNYYINNSNGTTKDIDADYFKVKFTLPTPEPLFDGDLYVFGALTNWQCNNISKMNYNFEKSQYEFHLLLKQGYYNYQYVYKPKNSNKFDLAFVERDHYETENDYLVFVYYKSVSSRYERIIGYKIANSVKKME